MELNTTFNLAQVGAVYLFQGHKNGRIYIMRKPGFLHDTKETIKRGDIIEVEGERYRVYVTEGYSCVGWLIAEDTRYLVTYFDADDNVVDTTEIDDNDEDFAWELFAEFGHTKTDKHSLTLEAVHDSAI